jgi:hypothetical protein
LFYGGLAPEPITFPSIATHHEIMFKGVSSSRWLQNTSAEQCREDVAEAPMIYRDVIPAAAGRLALLTEADNGCLCVVLRGD